MPIHRIAVLSDTHGTLRREAAEVLRTSELILHGGDIADRKTLEKLEKYARVIAVRGNCDREWTEGLPKEASFTLYDRKIYMVHDKKQMSAEAQKADLVIYGHSHRYEKKEEDGRIWLNPGSGGPRRFGRAATMALLTIDGESGKMAVERIDLSGGSAQEADKQSPQFGSGELRGIVEAVIKDLSRGRTVADIAKARRIRPALAEQIAQIYFTHPGIDGQGVMNRMEIAGR